MDDTIYRQAVVDEIEERISANGFSGNVGLISELNRLEGYVLRLPSAEQNSSMDILSKKKHCDLK